jgi:hypothetical protein
MSIEESKALVHPMVEEIFNRGNLNRVDEFLAPTLLNTKSSHLEYRAIVRASHS